MSWLLLFISVALIVFGLSMFRAWKTRKKAQENEKKKNNEKKPSMSVCPVCNTNLAKGENLYTRVYRSMDVPEQYCSINGCPHCFPICEPDVKRKCPVCGREIPIKGYLVAHLFNYPNGKRHVHVTGCSEEAHNKNRNLGV